MTELEPSPERAREVRLRDARPGSPIAFVARVVYAERREVVRKSDGQHRPVLSGLLSDGTATMRFTWWDPPREGVERGTVLRATNVEMREWQGRPELVFTWKTRAEPASEVELPSLGAEELPMRSVRELVAPDEGFRLEVRVTRCDPKRVTVASETKELFEGWVADRSGSIGFTAWKDFSLRVGDAIRVSGAYVKSFRRRPQLILDDRCRVERLSVSDLPDVAALLPSEPRPLAEWLREGGGDPVVAEGTVVALLPPSGVVYRCPTCRRTTVSGACRSHGMVAAEPDLSARIVIDDGRGTATVAASREWVERMTGLRLEDALATLRATPDPSRLEEQLFEAMFGRQWRIAGRGSVDDFGLTVYPFSAEEAPPSLEARRRRVEERIGRSGDAAA